MHGKPRQTPYARLLAAERVEQGHRPGEVAKQLGVASPATPLWTAIQRSADSRVTTVNKVPGSHI